VWWLVYFSASIVRYSRFALLAGTLLGRLLRPLATKFLGSQFSESVVVFTQCTIEFGKYCFQFGVLCGYGLGAQIAYAIV
jgi:hypothetical protein